MVKEHNKRNLNERVEQCITLVKKLHDLGFHPESSGLKELSKATNEFIKESKEYHGIIKFDEYAKVRLIVNLNLSKNLECSINIKH